MISKITEYTDILTVHRQSVAYLEHSLLNFNRSMDIANEVLGSLSRAFQNNYWQDIVKTVSDIFLRFWSQAAIKKYAAKHLNIDFYVNWVNDYLRGHFSYLECLDIFNGLYYKIKDLRDQFDPVSYTALEDIIYEKLENLKLKQPYEMKVFLDFGQAQELITARETYCLFGLEDEQFIYATFLPDGSLVNLKTADGQNLSGDFMRQGKSYMPLSRWRTLSQFKDFLFTKFQPTRKEMVKNFIFTAGAVSAISFPFGLVTGFTPQYLIFYGGISLVMGLISLLKTKITARQKITAYLDYFCKYYN